MITTSSGEPGPDRHIKLLKDTTLPGGKFGKAGSVEKVPGDVARRLQANRVAEYTDAPKPKRTRRGEIEHRDPVTHETRDAG